MRIFFFFSNVRNAFVTFILFAFASILCCIQFSFIFFLLRFVGVVFGKLIVLYVRLLGLYMRSRVQVELEQTYPMYTYMDSFTLFHGFNRMSTTKHCTLYNAYFRKIFWFYRRVDILFLVGFFNRMHFRACANWKLFGFKLI